MNLISMLSLVVSSLGPAPKFDVLVQAPEFTQTDLQVICLFRTSPKNKFTGALTMTDDALKGLLGQVRSTNGFEGVLGETLVITPPAGDLKAKKLMLVGLGDSTSFTPERMRLVGKIVMRECENLHVTHPFFAPTVKDGGVDKFTTGEVAQQFVLGVLDQVKLSDFLHAKGAGDSAQVSAITYLAGPKYAASTQQGIQLALQSKK